MSRPDASPARGGEIEAWVRRWRDLYPDGPTFRAIDAMLDDLRDRSDVGASWLAPVDDTRGYPEEIVGMVVDGDVLRDVIADAVPDWLSDDAARATAERVLNGAVLAGMTVLQGPEHKPRVVAPGAGQDQTTEENR